MGTNNPISSNKSPAILANELFSGPSDSGDVKFKTELLIYKLYNKSFDNCGLFSGPSGSRDAKLKTLITLRG